MEMRNPFRLLKTEQVGSDARFHFLFGYQMLQMFEGNADSLWDRLQIIRSAPGGGKTSLLRFFTVESLLSIYKHRNNEDYGKLFEMVYRLGAFTSEGPAILGVLIPCTQPFSQIEDLSLDDKIKDRLFFALLNVRALFGILKAVCVLNQIKYPEELKLISLSSRCYENSGFIEMFPIGNGQDLFERGKEIERKIIKLIDSVRTSLVDNLPGLSNLLVWQVFAPGTLICNGRRVEAKTLFMLDDIHKLSPRQRAVLLGELELIYPTARWVAERYESLNTAESLFSASTKGREYNLYRIEKWASDMKSRSLFKKGLEYIADRRVASSSVIDAITFESLLDNELDKKNEERCEYAIKTISLRVHEAVKKQKRFEPWIEEINNFESDDKYEIATKWRKLEILMKRKIVREPTLFPDLNLSTQELDKMDSSAVKNSARLFIANEFHIPYYFGLSTLKLLSSGNVEQFLSIAGYIFEEILAVNTMRRKEPTISVKRQHSIIERVAKERLEQLPKRTINGLKIHRLLHHIGDFAQTKTFDATAPYAPGVTGIAISSSDQVKLSDEEFLIKKPQYKELASVLREAIANNVFEPRSGQQCKGQEWLVLYLNRLLCVNFNLPLEYGGWKEQNLETLNFWLRTPYPKKSSIKGMFE